MRKNNALLAAAITATFIVSMNTSYAGVTNYPDCGANTTISCTTPYPGTNAATSITESLVPITDQAQGIIYSTHLFGDTSGTLSFPSGTEYAAVVLRIDGTITKAVQIIASLDSASGAKFSGTPKLVYKGADPNIPSTPTPTDNSCDKLSSCKWRFGGDNPITEIKNGDEFFIVYKITSASSLGTNNNKVDMKVDFGTIDLPTISTQTITVATGRDPFTLHFKGTENPYIKVSVASENKQFITQMPSTLGTDDEWRNANNVLFGYMLFTLTEGVKASNGYTNWELGNVTANAEFDAGYSTTNSVFTSLTISEEGQFAASTGSNGDVYLYIANAEIPATSVTETGEATWELSNSNLYNIMSTPGASLGDCVADNSTGNYRCVPIGLIADGTTPINIPPEDPPKAQLVLNYNMTTNQQNIKYPADDVEERLTKYIQDGISCWVFNVPYSGAVDDLHLRIFNDSSNTLVNSDGTPTTECVYGTFYANDGTASEKVALGCPQAGGVLYVNTGNLADKVPGFPSGTGRGTMFITSTLSKMEVLAMLRRKIPPCFGGSDESSCSGHNNPLTNISTGAHGVACAPNYR